MSAVKKQPKRMRDVLADDTTEEQRATYYAALHMLAEAKQPRTVAEMRERLTDLLGQVRREAKLFGVPRDQWQAECEVRLRELLTALGYEA